MSYISDQVSLEPNSLDPINSMFEAKSLLGLNLGDIEIRAFYFDCVDNRYRLINQTTSYATFTSPRKNVWIHVLNTIYNLQNLIGVKLLDDDHHLIQPVQSNGVGVDQIVGTTSAGSPLKIIILGLVDQQSISSAIHLANSTYCGELVIIDLHASQDRATQIDTLLQTQPDIIIVCGGFNEGATKSVFHLFETVSMACQLMATYDRPIILYSGNQTIQDKIKSTYENLLDIRFASNIRPASNTEDIDSAMDILADITKEIKIQQNPHIGILDELTKKTLLPTSPALGRVIKFLSKARTSDKGVLGLTIDSSSVTIASSYNGILSLNTFTELGLGRNLQYLLESDAIKNINLWLNMDVPINHVKAYLLNKQIQPISVPATDEDLAIELALARHLIQTAIKKSSNAQPTKLTTFGYQIPPVEPIISAGDIFTHVPNLAHSMLVLLDGFQPLGATTFVLDQYHLAGVLGAAAEVNPTLTIQVLDSNAFLHLGTIVSPIGLAKIGSPILRASMIDENGYEIRTELNLGSIEVLPLAADSSATLTLHPLQKFDVGMGGPGIGGKLKVKGGAMGVVLDGRGRPIILPKDPEERYQRFQNWLRALKV